MKSYEFDIILSDKTEVTEEQANALYEAGCDDGTLASCAGVSWIHFDREAPSLEEAIRTALAQVRSTGMAVAKIELDTAATPGNATKSIQVDYASASNLSRVASRVPAGKSISSR